MNLLVVMPPCETLMPGPAYIAAALREDGHSVQGHVFTKARELEKCLDGIDVVLTGGLCSQYYSIRKTIRTAKRMGVKTILGGGIVSSEPELMTRDLNPDFSVLGEGEMTVREFLGGKVPINEISGIAYLDGKGEFIQNPRRKEIECLDDLPEPAYDLFGYSERLDRMRPSDVVRDPFLVFDRPRLYSLIASRSCPYKCTFCYHTCGDHYRYRSIASVFAELGRVVPLYRINIISIMDELFATDRDRLNAFCNEMQKLRQDTPWSIKWCCNLRVSVVTPDLLATMKACGCCKIVYGFESYSNDVLRSMKKHITSEQIEFAVRETMKHGITVDGSFILGDPSETEETASETIKYWQFIVAQGASSSMVPLYLCPNSADYRLAVYRNKIRNKLKHITRKLFTPINITTMSDWKYYRLVSRIYKLRITNQLFVVPGFRGNRMSYVCPSSFCNNELISDNFSLPALQSRRMWCPSCGRVSVLVGRWGLLLRRFLRFLPDWFPLFYYYQRLSERSG